MKSELDEDLEKFHKIAIEAHSRFTDQRSIYVRLQTIVENVAHRRVADRTGNRKRVLELGVGGGEHVEFEGSEQGGRLYVLSDLDAGFCRLAHERHGLPALVADCRFLPFADKSFDGIIATAVLEHVDGLGLALREIYRVLEPGGRLFVVVPTNGGFALNLFKILVTYPFMRFRDIRRPDLVWHFENASSFKRIDAMLQHHFSIVERFPIPFKWLAWRLAPVYAFLCERPLEQAAS